MKQKPAKIVKESGKYFLASRDYIRTNVDDMGRGTIWCTPYWNKKDAIVALIAYALEGQYDG